MMNFDTLLATGYDIIAGGSKEKYGLKSGARVVFKYDIIYIYINIYVIVFL